MIDLVVLGLGNPGKKYEMTRHNLGFLVVQALGAKMGWHLKEERQFAAKVAKGKVNETTVHLVMPLTFMNESGVAARRYLDYHKLSPSQIIVVADDVALPFGQLRLREVGSSGGHNGLKSLENHLGTQSYVRLRMGIGNAPSSDRLKDHVLDCFTEEELEQLTKFIDSGIDVILRITNREELVQVMNDVNAKVKA